MRGTLKVDHKSKKIVMNATFEKYSMVCSSDEFEYLMSIKAIFPDYTVITKKAEVNPKANRYKGLKYDFMKWYIKKNSPKEVADIEIAKIDAAKALSTRHDGTYGKVKSWFLENHKELKDKKTVERLKNQFFDSVLGDKAQNMKAEATCNVAKVRELVENNQTVDEILLDKAG